jgi:hypothetical protein
MNNHIKIAHVSIPSLLKVDAKQVNIITDGRHFNKV